MTNPILIIEDEHALASALAAVCRRLGHDARLCASGAKAFSELVLGEFSLVILDIGLPDMSGLEVLERIRRDRPALPVIIVTAHGTLDNAVAAKRLGAASYLLKPLELHEVQETMRQVLSATLPAAVPQSFAMLVGAAPAMQRSFVEIAHACASDVPVLIAGPTGTGKTLTAKVIHANGARRAAPFITLHCSALPESLLEAELFGHEKNAFTGAGAARPGHIERAQGGTLFLDEIGDIPLSVQAKLLRFVEERTFTRVGGREDLRVNLRLITATHKALREEVRAGRFREDLYYRLHVLEIAMPALRERGGDLPALANFFLGSLCPERSVQLAPASLELLARHDWPGNVRELRNVLEHAIAVSSGSVILPHHLPRDIRECVSLAVESDTLQPVLAAWLDTRLKDGANYNTMAGELEEMALRHLLTRFDNKPTILARETGMNRVTLRRKCRQFSIGVQGLPDAGEDSDG
ncbi:MAG: Fis family transcriptional regulator [Chthoniobacteraceae bacterium]|nr:Fis family transcriptional regulator [Chthoniobacteraceae bacterium]